jgi:two-component system CheB/CheR fusion protein
MWTTLGSVERREDHAAAVFSNAQLLGAIVDASEDAIIVKSVSGRIVSWNAAAERLFGYAASEAIGRHISIVIPAQRIPEEQAVLRQLLAGDRIRRFETVRQRKDGQHVAVELSVTPVKSVSGQIVGAVTAARDLRERRGAQAIRVENEERFQILADELALTNRRKDEFLAALSHAIRNPLSAIRSGLTIIKPGRLDAATGARTWAMVDRQLAHLGRLLDELLDVSRNSHGRLTITVTDIDARVVVENAVATVRPKFEAAGVALSLTLPDAPVAAWGDAARIEQILLNVLSNAARYTPRGGHAELTVRTEGRDVVAVVTDSGLGIPADLLPHIFEMFCQSLPGPAVAPSGLGTGLYLARAFAALHGGAITAVSKGSGKGSTFTIRLPIVKNPEVPPMHARENSVRTGEVAAPTRRVLIVDDELDNAEGLALLCRLAGHEVEVAQDGPTAIEKAKSFHPEVVVLDIGMPGMDGIETCRQLRDLSGPRPFVIAVTGWGLSADYDRTRAAGFDHHLVKPVEPQQFLAMLSASPRPDTV